jgi:hypothetical protein
MGRVESGYLPTEFKQQLQTLQTLTYAAVVLVLVLFTLQMFLLCNGTYEVFWGQMLSVAADAARGP